MKHLESITEKPTNPLIFMVLVLPLGIMQEYLTVTPGWILLESSTKGPSNIRLSHGIADIGF